MSSVNTSSSHIPLLFRFIGTLAAVGYTKYSSIFLSSGLGMSGSQIASMKIATSFVKSCAWTLWGVAADSGIPLPFLLKITLVVSTLLILSLQCIFHSEYVKETVHSPQSSTEALLGQSPGSNDGWRRRGGGGGGGSPGGGVGGRASRSLFLVVLCVLIIRSAFNGAWPLVETASLSLLGREQRTTTPSLLSSLMTTSGRNGLGTQGKRLDEEDVGVDKQIGDELSKLYGNEDGEDAWKLVVRICLLVPVGSDGESGPHHSDILGG